MRRIFFFLIIGALFIVSCNSDDTNDAGTPATAASIPEQLKEQVKKYPDSILLRETLIQNYRDSGEYDSAIAETKTTIARDSLNGVLWEHLFWLYYEDQDTANAITSLEKAISLNANPQYYITL